jgi:uncharacterized protein (DUF983 family)
VTDIHSVPVMRTGDALPKSACWRAALLCRCPHCGEGGLYHGLLQVRPACGVCTLDLRGHDSGDGPVFVVLSFLCLVAVIGALALEFTVAPPLWAQAIGWAVALPMVAIVLLRPVKALMIAHRYRVLGTAEQSADADAAAD